MWTWQFYEVVTQIAKVWETLNFISFHHISIVSIMRLFGKAQRILVWEKRPHSEPFGLCNTHTLDPISCLWANAFNSGWTLAFSAKEMSESSTISHYELLSSTFSLSYVFKYIPPTGHLHLRRKHNRYNDVLPHKPEKSYQRQNQPWLFTFLHLSR